MTAPQGHVFVVRGDLTSLMCDWWLLPSGTDAHGVPGEIGTHYLCDDRVREAASRPDWRQRAPTLKERATALVETGGGPGVERHADSARGGALAMLNVGMTRFLSTGYPLRSRIPRRGLIMPPCRR